jgi:hypothetical protein
LIFLISRLMASGLKRGLVHPDCLDTGEPVRVIDPGLVVLADRGHRGAPTDPGRRTMALRHVVTHAVQTHDPHHASGGDP